nr:RNA polymerase II second largest subunit [Tanacetum cinerariifolium]
MGSKEETERLKRKGLNLKKEQVKKQMSSEEAPEIETSTKEFTEEKMKEMMQLVPVEDVYVQALQVKHPIIDRKVHTEEKDYPLRRGLALVMISYKLQIENYSQMAEDLIRKIYSIANTPRRLGHLNVKTMNKLVRHNLVRGLPTKSFDNDHTCTACLKRKQHKASCKSKLMNSVTKPLHTLHMDLFGPTSLNGVAKRRNRTLIETARTMLADVKLSVAFWAEAVNTACYVQNRVLVNKSQNKTPYELFNESSSSKPHDENSSQVPKGSGNPNPTVSSSNPLADQMETLTAMMTSITNGALFYGVPRLARQPRHTCGCSRLASDGGILKIVTRSGFANDYLAATLKNLTYYASLYVDVIKRAIKKGHDCKEVTETQDFGKVFIRKVLIMLRSGYYTLFQNSDKDLMELGECPYDQGRYFIINGSEKVLIAQEKMSTNHVCVSKEATEQICLCGRSSFNGGISK